MNWLWRSAADPWGRDVLIGVSWDLMWLAVGLAVLFVVGHTVWYRSRVSGGHEEEAPVAAPPGIPERIERHSLAARLFHWTMAASMLTLLLTAFVPIMGFDFPAWLTIHWVAGLVLIATIVYHIIHSIGWQDFWSMSPRPRDIGEGVAQLKHLMSSSAPEPEKAGKYPFDHRLYHPTIVVASLAAIITGVMMMIRIATPLFAGGNPYYLSEATVGLVFVIHGFAGVSFILLVASHIYFALRPEKHWLTWSMIRGWIGRDDYVAHFDPDKWVVTGESGGASSDTGGGALADSTVSAPREDG